MTVDQWLTVVQVVMTVVNGVLVPAAWRAAALLWEHERRLTTLEAKSE